MATLSVSKAVSTNTPSLIGGAMIIGGTIIGAGMFSLPVVMSGALRRPGVRAGGRLYRLAKYESGKPDDDYRTGR